METTTSEVNVNEALHEAHRRGFSPEDLLEEARQQVKDELEAARRESAIAEADVLDLQQENDRVQTEALDAKLSLKKHLLEHEREKSTYQHEIQELQRNLKDKHDQVEDLEVKLIIANKQVAAAEAEARQILHRAEAAEENGRFLKSQMELRKKESLARVRKDFEERMIHIEMENKEYIAKLQADHEQVVQKTVSDGKKLYEGRIKEAKAALLHSQHEALILGEKLKSAEARVRQLEEANGCGQSVKPYSREVKA